MNYLLFICLIMLSSGVISFVLNHEHLLNSLLSLEMLSISIFFMISISAANLGFELFYLLYFLVILVCEGVSGLSLLIIAAYSYSNDYLSYFNFLTC